MSSKKQFTVVVDPGHGGKDSGAIGPTGLKEKDVVLDIAKKIQSLFAEEIPEVNFILTRSDDRFLSLSKRAKIANKANADVFVSIHCNSATNPANGTETFIARRTKVSFPLGEMIQDYMVRWLGTTDRGVKRANFTVLTETGMAAALAEVQFIHITEGETQLSRDVFKDEAATAIGLAIHEFLGLQKADKGIDKVIAARPDPPEPKPCKAIELATLVKHHAKELENAAIRYGG